MLNHIWAFMITTGLIALMGQPNTELGAVTAIIVSAAGDAVQLAIALAGILAFWSGIMQLAQDAGLTAALARLLTPLLRWLFPDVPKNHSALGAIFLSLAANLLGLGNAATPLGIQAIKQLQSLNPRPTEASDAMCTFIAICASGLTLIPTTIIALRGVTGAKNPHAIVGGTLFATTCATVAALSADRLLRQASKASS